MSYTYNEQELIAFFNKIIERQLDEKAKKWLRQQALSFLDNEEPKKLRIGFSAVARFAGRKVLKLKEEEQQELSAIRKNLLLNNRPMDQLLRFWYLLHFPAKDKEYYITAIESLFEGAEMNELAALYASLPLLAYPEAFKARAAEGIRTNMGIVFEAIALDNPYPMEYLEENAWNQLVLKAFFMEKPVGRIIGLDERANPRLAEILHDYAHERWSAYRDVDPQLWRPVAPFINKEILQDIKKLFAGNEREQQAAALACANSSSSEAKQLLEEHKELKEKINSGRLNWED